MPRDEDDILLFAMFIIMVFLPVCSMLSTRCDRLGVIATSPVDEGVPKSEEMESYGSKHARHCRLDEGVVPHFGNARLDTLASRDGRPASGRRWTSQGWTVDPFPVPACDGCGIHAHGTVLKEPAGSKWKFPEPNGARFKINPHRLKFCQDSISRFFHDGTSVFKRCEGTPKILACFHKELDGIRLFALNNRTLFNAIYRNLNEVIVNIIEKPEDWPRRFTGRRLWMCIEVRQRKSMAQSDRVEPHCGWPDAALRIPDTAFPGGEEHRSICFVVLEVRNLVNPRKKDTLFALLKDMSSDLDVRAVEGPRAYARVRINENDVPLVRSMVKAIAERMGKQVWTVECVEVEDMRLYDSPRN